jgi:hypothetical protein
VATFYSGRAPTAYPFLDDILELMPNNNSGQSQALGVLFKLPQLKRLLVAESSKDNIADSVHESAHNNLVKLGFSFFFITTLIISKKPGNTGISRDIRTEFTTDLLLSD